MIDTQYLTVKQLSEKLQMHEDIILADINAGKLVAINVAKNAGSGKRPRWRIPEAEAARWIVNRSNRPLTAPVKPAKRRPVAPKCRRQKAKA